MTANAVFSTAELEQQLRSSIAQVIITCAPLLETALQTAKAVGIPSNKIFILELPAAMNDEILAFRTIEDLISEGRRLPELEPLKWVKGQGARQPAFLCYSSGTSGLPVSLASHKMPSSPNGRLEGGHDIAPQYYWQRSSAFDVRICRPRSKGRRSSKSSGSASIQSHLCAYCRCSYWDMARRRGHCASKVRIRVLPQCNSKIQN